MFLCSSKANLLKGGLTSGMDENGGLSLNSRGSNTVSPEKKFYLKVAVR